MVSELHQAKGECRFGIGCKAGTEMGGQCFIWLWDGALALGCGRPALEGQGGTWIGRGLPIEPSSLCVSLAPCLEALADALQEFDPDAEVNPCLDDMLSLRMPSTPTQPHAC